MNSEPPGDNHSGHSGSSLAELNRYSELQAALPDFCRQVMSSLKLEEVLNQLCKLAENFLGADYITFALIEKGRFGEVASIGPGDQTTMQALAPAYLSGKGVGGQAYRTRQVATSYDYWKDPNFEHSPLIDTMILEKGIQSCLAIPIILDGEVAALLWADKKITYIWTGNDVEWARQFAELAGLAIHNARLYGRLETLNQELTARNHELEALQKFNKRLRGPSELQPTAARALQLMMEVVRADAGAIHLLEHEQAQQLTLIAHSGFDLPLPPWLTDIKVGAGLAGTAVQTGEMIHVHDVKELLRQQPGITLDPNPKWCSGLFVPLPGSDRVIGAIGLVGWKPEHFSPEQLRFVEMMAEQVAVAVERVGQHQQEKERGQLEAVLNLARMTAHELRQPLTVIQGELDLMQVLGQAMDEERYERVQRALDTLNNRVTDYQNFVRKDTNS